MFGRAAGQNCGHVLKSPLWILSRRIAQAMPIYKLAICKLSWPVTTCKSAVCQQARAGPTHKSTTCNWARFGPTFSSSICPRSPAPTLLRTTRRFCKLARPGPIYNLSICKRTGARPTYKLTISKLRESFALSPRW